MILVDWLRNLPVNQSALRDFFFLIFSQQESVLGDPHNLKCGTSVSLRSQILLSHGREEGTPWLLLLLSFVLRTIKEEQSGDSADR